MRNVYPRVLAAMVILALTGAPAAAKSGFKTELDFRPGGQTIGGPGFHEIPVGLFDVAWFVQDADADVCATVANISDVRLKFKFESGSIGYILSPGQTKTVCLLRVRFLTIECAGDDKTPKDAKCEALWRIDKFQPSAPKTQ